LRDVIDRWNKSPEGKKLEKSRGQPLRTTDNKMKLIEKIMAYDMYKTINIELPPKPTKKVTETPEQAKAKRELEKKKNKLSALVNAMYTKYLRRKGKDDKKDIISDLNEEWEGIVEENEEFFEENEDFYDNLESFIEVIKKKIKSDEVIKSFKQNVQDMRIDDK
jgi:hypothetical protein